MTKRQNKRLTKKQKEALLEWISEGIETDEINLRAGEFNPPFKVIRQQVGHYRKTRKVKIKQIEAAVETSALKRGYAVREERAKVLNRLATRLAKELKVDKDYDYDMEGFEGDRLWLDQRKSIGSSPFVEFVNYEEFNQAEVVQLRGVLDDLAKEVGDRRQKHDVSVNAREALAALLGVSPDDLPADPATSNA